MTSPPTSQVVPGLHRIGLGPAAFVNAYVVETDEGLVLFDTGFPGDGQAILAGIEAAGLDVGRLQSILISHAHMDHSGSANELRGLTGAKVFASQPDADLLASGFSGRGLKVRPGCDDIFWARIESFAGPEARDAIDIVAPPPCEPVQVDGFLEAGSEAPGLRGSQVLATPGHSLGHVSVLVPSVSALLAGDAAEHFEAVTAPVPAEDFEAADASFALLGDLDFETVVFGHGEPVVSGAPALLRAQRGA